MKSVPSDVLERLSSVGICSVQQAANLQVFGLRWSAGNGLDYTTLDEALRDKVLDVTEINDGGQVPAIKVANRSERMVFLMAGELLVGCKQDRVLNSSMMVQSKSEMAIPVTCVEVGRWSYRSRKFGSAHTSSHGYLRMMLSKQTSARYKTTSAPASDQRAVWAEVARKMSKMGSRSSSGALQDVFRDYDDKLDQVVRSVSSPVGCNGVAFAMNGKILGVDLFDKPATLSKLWPKLIKSYALDALEDETVDQKLLQPESVIEWTRSAQSAKQEWFDSPGVGQDVRIEGEMLIGAALVVEQQPVHLELFRERREIGDGLPLFQHKFRPQKEPAADPFLCHFSDPSRKRRKCHVPPNRAWGAGQGASRLKANAIGDIGKSPEVDAGHHETRPAQSASHCGLRRFGARAHPSRTR